MADFGARSLATLDGVPPAVVRDGAVKPITRARAVALAEYVTRHGGDIGVSDYGGRRSLATQTQLYQWRADSIAKNDNPDTAVVEGAYPVAKPSATAPHVTGDAFDVHVIKPMTGLDVEQTYRAMAVFAPTLGLKAGYFFSTPDIFHFENADRPASDAPVSPGEVLEVFSTDDATGSSGSTPWPVVVALALLAVFLLTLRK